MRTRNRLSSRKPSHQRASPLPPSHRSCPTQTEQICPIHSPSASLLHSHQSHSCTTPPVMRAWLSAGRLLLLLLAASALSLAATTHRHPHDQATAFPAQAEEALVLTAADSSTAWPCVIHTWPWTQAADAACPISAAHTAAACS